MRNQSASAPGEESLCGSGIQGRKQPAGCAAKKGQSPDTPARYVLVLGAPRSGTTLLAAMIGAHTEVGMLNEDTGKRMGLAWIVGKNVTGNKLCIPNQVQLKRRSSLFLKLLKKLNIVRESPSSNHSIEDYLRLPDIKIIAIVRNGNDVISSIMTRGHSRFRKAARRWRQAVETIYELKTRCPSVVMTVPFEVLVRSPESTMRRVTAYLGLEFQEKTLEGYRYVQRYPENRIDKEKADRAVKEKIDFDLANRFPDAYEKYRRICQADAEWPG